MICNSKVFEAFWQSAYYFSSFCCQHTHHDCNYSLFSLSCIESNIQERNYALLIFYIGGKSNYQPVLQAGHMTAPLYTSSLIAILPISNKHAL
jgi:hypothetical protein